MKWYGALGVVALLLGVSLFGGGVYFSLQQEEDLSDVEKTEGTVVSTTLEPAENDGFYPRVTYRYQVGGENYTNDRVFPGDRRGSSESDAREVINRYRSGDTVEVYYRESPADSTLRVPRSPVPVFGVGFGFVLSAFGFLLAVAGRQAGRDPIVTDEVTLPGTEPDTDPDDGDDG
jgi:hypothetical protein